MSTAQHLQGYWGPTLGISVPGFGRTDNFTDIYGQTFETHTSPIPSPVVGANGGLTVKKHLALDAALQYSYLGRSCEVYYPLFIQGADRLEERLRIHKISLPATVGYAGSIGGTHFRIGVGGTLQYLLTGRGTIDFYSLVNGVPTPLQAKFNLFDESVATYGGRRIHALPRISLSVCPSRRWMVSAAYSHGRQHIVTVIPLQVPLYSSAPRASAIDLTATYLLRTSSSAGNAREETPVE